MPINAFGYQKEGANQLLELREVTLAADPTTLRVIANHLTRAAQAIERHPRPSFRHVHLRDIWPEWTDGDVDIIVARGDSERVN